MIKHHSNKKHTIDEAKANDIYEKSASSSYRSGTYCQDLYEKYSSNPSKVKIAFLRPTALRRN